MSFTKIGVTDLQKLNSAGDRSWKKLCEEIQFFPITY